MKTRGIGLSCIIVEDPVFDKHVVLSLEAIASKNFHLMDCAWQAEQNNLAWLYLSLMICSVMVSGKRTSEWQ